MRRPARKMHNPSQGHLLARPGEAGGTHRCHTSVGHDEFPSSTAAASHARHGPPSITVPHSRMPGGIVAFTVGAAVLASAPALTSAPALASPLSHHAIAAVPRVVTHAVSLAAQKRALRYWTLKRMRSARPPKLTHEVRLGKPGTVRHAKPQRVPGGKPMPVKALAMVRPPRDVASPMGYPFPYSSFEVPARSYTKWPYSLNGKIFFVNGGVNYACSGTSVASLNGPKLENEVWTAGHCVSNTNLSSHLWDSMAIFVPAYNGTAASPTPFGIFVATRLATVNTFFYGSDISEDHGAMTVGRNASGLTLGQAVGWDGFAWNYPTTEKFTVFGYPAAAPYTGNAMVEDISATGAIIIWPGGAGGPLIGIGNPMTGGSSGGAWNIFWNAKSGGYINGHNDYKFFVQPRAMYSPYQDSLTNRVRCFGAVSC